MNKPFGRHVDRRANVYVLEFLSKVNSNVLCKFSEPKISYFSVRIMHKDIRDLKISVNHVFLCQVIEAVEDVLDDGFSSILIKITVFSETRLKITFIAKFSDDIAVSIAGKNLKAP